MENRILEVNLESLDKVYSGWRTCIEKNINQENKECNEEVEFFIDVSYGGEKITKVKADGGVYYLSGKYNPQGMAMRCAQKLGNTDFGTVVLVIGFSDGRALRELLNTVSKETIVLVYEPSIELFIHILHEYDVADLFQNHEFVLIVEELNGNELKNVIKQAVKIENLPKMKTIVMGNYERLFADRVKSVIAVLNKYVADLCTHWNTCVTFTNETIINSIKNYKYMYRHYSINALCHTLPENVPVIVVAAGPSLDKNIELLSKAKGKACIIACDTALKPLLRRGIIPDFFVVVDPRKPLELFEHPQIQDIPMISGLNIPYQIMEQHTGKKVLYLDVGYATELLKFVFEGKTKILKKGMGIVPTGGCVATTAFSAGRLMGTKTIILVGQDLALTGEKEHAEGTFKKDRKFNLESQSLPKVEGINGEMIPTLKNLKAYLEWFEEQIKIYSDLEVIDATEGGALIHGSKILTLEETIDTYCVEEFNQENYWKKIEPHFSEDERVKAITFFRKIPEELEYIKKQVIHGKKEYIKMEKCAKKENYSIEDIKKSLKKVSKITETLEKSELANLIIGGLKGVEYTIRVTAYQFQDDEQKNIIESAQAGQRFLESMEIAINEVMPEIRKLSEFRGEY